MSGIHEYFNRTFSEWNIEDFLNKCDIEQFDIKIDRYLKSLEIIADYETGKRKERATLLLNKYRKDDRPDYQIARKWRKNHDPTGTIGGSSFHLHNPTFTGNPLMGNSGSVSGGSFFNFSEHKSKRNQEEDNNEESKRRKIDGEDYKPYLHVKIPPPRVVTPPPHPPRTPEHQIFSSSSLVSSTTRSKSDDEETYNADNRNPNDYTFDEYVDGDDTDDDDQEKLFLNDSIALDDETDDDHPYMFQEKNVSALFRLYRSKSWQMALESGLSIETDYHEILSLSHILLLQTNNYSDLQIEQFSGDTLADFHKHMRNTCIVKTKVAQGVKTIFRECIETALDEDLGLKEAEKIVERSFTRSFDDPTDQKKFERMRFIFLQLTKNIPVKPLKDLLSEGTLTVNIISPILRSFFHDSSIHPAIWPNTASMSAKVRKLANLDPSRAKQPDMIGNVVNNNKSKYEMMFGEITGEGKNNNVRKNNLDLIRLGIFLKDALDLLIKKTGKEHMTFAWQTIVTTWTGYIMVLTASGLYIMFDIGETELPKSFQTCGQFINGIDNLFTFTEKYEYEVQRLHGDINKKKDTNIPVEIINRLRATLGTPQFKDIIKRK